MNLTLLMRRHIIMTTDLERPTPEVTDDQMALIRDTIAKGATDEQLRLFLYDNSRRGVHPLDKMIHFTLRSGRYTPITSIDFMRSRAAATGSYAGNDDAVFLARPDGKTPNSATVTVYRLVGGHRCPFSATARWSEYYPDGAARMWNKMPHTMIAKCAEALALRKGFPQELSGLYAREEMDQAGDPDNGTAVTLDVSAPPPATHPPVTAIEETEAAPQGDIPAGTWRLTQLQERQKKSGDPYWSVTAVADDGEEHRMTMWDDLSQLCREVIQSCEPVILDTKKGSYRGDLQYTLRGIHRRTADGDTTPDEEEAPPAPDELGPPVLSLDEIPF